MIKVEGFGNIVPYQRIKELEYFYTSDSVKNDKVIDIVDVKEKKKFSEEVQGLWALEQIEAVLDILRVRMFVLPKDKGGVEMPDIQSREEYVRAHVEVKAKGLDNISDALEAREAYIEVLRAKMEAARGRRSTMMFKKESRRLKKAKPEEEVKDQDTSMNSSKILQEDDEEDDSRVEEIDDLEEVNEDFAKAYQKWNKEQKSQNEDSVRKEDILENCRKQANRQHDEDADATNRLLSSLFVLKKYIQGMIKKFPFLEDIVRQKRSDGIDPYDDNDLRTCYNNLLDRYRQSDEMGVLTTIMSGMAEKQGSKSMSEFLLCVEDWHQTMIRLGVQHISMSDLAAIITLKGMNEKNRIEFLQQENALEMTLNTLEQEDNFLGDDDTTMASGKKEKKTLLVRVKKFIQQDKNQKLINQRLSGGSGISNSASKSISKKEAEDNLREAQNVFMATLDGKMVCREFAKSGKCKFGQKCKLKHGDEGSEKQGSKDKAICFSWRDTGVCKWGMDKCRFNHPPKTQEKVITVQTTEKEEKKNATVTKSLFNIDDSGDSWGNNSDVVSCIITSSSDSECDQVMSVEHSNTPERLGWDTMASIHVAKDKSGLNQVNLLKKQRRASGMGGTLPITHQGYNNKFKLHMHVIEGGKTPNIKSVGKSLQPDGDGTEYVAIFTAKGATQMKMTKRTKQQLMQIMNEADSEDRILGTAVQRNGVYEEDFGSESDHEASEEEKAFAVTSMYTHRVPMSSADDIIGMLASACVKEEHLIAGIKENSIKGLPECVNESAVRSYFKMHGKDQDIIMAEIANAPLKTPIDYERETFDRPGEHLQMDNVDPSFARIKGEKTPIRSVGGYRDAVVAVDNCGYSVVQGRETKKNPHLIVKRFIDKWKARWQTLKKLSADKEFITVETMRTCEELDIKVRQAVPYDHRRGLGASEGLNRWLQDCAQAHMNRLTVYVRLGLMSEQDKRSLWFHALTYANDVKLLAPSKTDHTKTQFEEGENTVFNFSTYVMLPFGLRVIIRKKEGDQDGRGLGGIYVGFSKVVVGGILVYVFSSKRVVQKYTFVPREPMPTLSDIDCEYAALALYGDLAVNQEHANKPGENALTTVDSTEKSKVRGVVRLASKHECKSTTQKQSEQDEEEDIKLTDNVSKEKVKSVHNHFTRSKKIRETVLCVTSERPPKPKIPTRFAALKSPRWMAAYRREIKKINEENVMVGLKAGANGEFVRPENAIVMRLLAILEWKWKPDPESGLEGWLECVRIVCDGSTDKREGENTYAETPDRTLMFLMASIEATLGIKSRVGDAVRAYLNAPSIDRNLVVLADKIMQSGEGNERFCKESLLLKGLYGSTKGALSFQVWADSKLAEINYMKCDVARGVYLKTIEDDIVRLYRHSDDFRLSAPDEAMDDEVAAIQGQIRTTPFKALKEFLGCTFVRYVSKTMVESDAGDIFLVTMIPQINKLEVDFGYLVKHYNPTGRVRHTPLPLKPVIDQLEMNETQVQLLPEDDIKLYMSLVMSLGWIVGNIRPNLKFSHHIIAKKLACPKVWDMYLAVWVLEHVVLTKEWPLVLGGDVVDPEVYSDASFASMEERRTVGGHALITGPKSGVIHAQVKTYKVAVKSIFEGEAMAASDGQDTEIYANRVVEELKYPSECGRRVRVDNTAAIDWMLGSVPSKRSKHMEVRLYRSRHLVQNGEVVMDHVPTDENIADLLTKSLPRGQYEILSKRMLGHELVAVKLRFWES